MKSFTCGAVVPGCAATFTADTEAELLGQIAEHARRDHGLAELPDDLVTAVHQNIHAA